MAENVDKALYDELLGNYNTLKEEYGSLQDLFMREISERNNRELEVLRRIYPYIANELDSFRKSE